MPSSASTALLEYSSAQGQAGIASGQAASASKRLAHEEVEGQAANAAGQAASAGEYSSAQEAAGSHSADSSAGQSVGSHDVGMVMVAYDAGSSPEASRGKLCNKWMKSFEGTKSNLNLFKYNG